MLHFSKVPELHPEESGSVLEFLPLPVYTWRHLTEEGCALKHYDIIVIGGGPAGIFAAGFAALHGAAVLLLEKNKRCGAKMLITGKGRCNVTNSEDDPRKLAERFGRQGKALLTALYAFGRDEVIEFFESRGLKLRIERGGRIFPDQGGAGEVQQVLDRFLQETGVELRTSCKVEGLIVSAGRVNGVKIAGDLVAADKVIVATGGRSYPETGSTGDGYRWAVQTGHRLVEPEPALVPVRLAADWTAEASHFNLKNVRIRVLAAGRQLDERFGEAFFTRSGIGGPIVLDMSAGIRDALKTGPVQLEIDFKPAIDPATFDVRLQRELAEQGKKDFRNALGNLLPKDLIPIFIRLSGIDPLKKCHHVTAVERQQLLALFKSMTLEVAGVGDFKRAIVTSGGISLADIDMRTMQSKQVENLYFCGETIDVDGPTGGFNLQVCWSTGYLAGVSAATVG
jgi:predicted Rossmann fold flavoprotein